MNTSTFFRHYEIQENPFRAEEARQDSVFSRVEHICHHPDYEKVRGEFDNPSAAIVFGERGTGKTAMRLQIEQDLDSHNLAHSEMRCLGIAYDDLNPVLDRFHQQLGLSTADESLAKFKLIDHIDGIMASIVPPIIDQVLGEARGEPALHAEDSLARTYRQAEPSVKRDLLLLQVCYDRPEEADLRTRQVRQKIRSHMPMSLPLMKWGSLVGLVLSLLAMVLFFAMDPQEQRWLWILGIGILLAVTAGLGGRFLWQWMKLERIAHQLAKSLRVMHRPRLSFRYSLLAIHPDDVFASELPVSLADDTRFAMVQRLLRVVRPLGYRSILVLFDRIDEPTLINGNVKRMKSIVWPLMNNKFLQQDRFGIKMLLPLDLKHELFRESTEFFREARLDKQNLVERLTWSGAMLYDICTARLNACRPEGSEAISLRDLFDESVSHQDLVDALDQMQQPRDAFKLMYQIVQEHCANVPEEQPVWKVPKLMLDSVRKHQVERMGNMLRGVRPA
jgi:hypothetical protein